MVSARQGSPAWPEPEERSTRQQEGPASLQKVLLEPLADLETERALTHVKGHLDDLEESVCITLQRASRTASHSMIPPL